MKNFNVNEYFLHNDHFFICENNSQKIIYKLIDFEDILHQKYDLRNFSSYHLIAFVEFDFF